MSSFKNHPVHMGSVSFLRKRYYFLPKRAVEGIGRAAATMRVKRGVIYFIRASCDSRLRDEIEKIYYGLRYTECTFRRYDEYGRTETTTKINLIEIRMTRNRNGIFIQNYYGDHYDKL